MRGDTLDLKSMIGTEIDSNFSHPVTCSDRAPPVMMSLVTNQMANDRREAACISVTPERKYYRQGDAFIKRSLRPSEWQVSQFRGTVHVPRQGRERLLNEAACLQFVRESSSMPVPKLHCVFEDDGAVYVVMEDIEGVTMDNLEPAQKEIVRNELMRHLGALHSLKSSRLGGPSGLVVPPYRVRLKTFKDHWHLHAAEMDNYVFCHNDLSQHNVIVDVQTMKIKAIIDWEYAGFYPERFEGHFFERAGPSVARGSELDDTQDLVQFLESMEVSRSTENQLV